MRRDHCITPGKGRKRSSSLVSHKVNNPYSSFRGVSRSASIIIAFLIDHLKLSLSEAIALVKTQRPCVSPNVGFMRELKEFESQNVNNVLRSSLK